MKISASKLISEMKKIEGLLDSNFNATGSNLRDKILTATKQMPKGIVEKLTYLAGLYERAQHVERPEGGPEPAEHAVDQDGGILDQRRLSLHYKRSPDSRGLGIETGMVNSRGRSLLCRLLLFTPLICVCLERRRLSPND